MVLEPQCGFGQVRGIEMRIRVSALELRRFKAEERARKIVDLGHMIREFEHGAAELERQIRAEEDRTRIKDPAHFAYSTFAKSASQRRDNLRTSADALKAKLEAAKGERDETLEQFNGVNGALHDCRRVEPVMAASRDINRQRRNPQWMCNQEPALETKPHRIASSGSFS
jgi:flagellar FliJ protein